jgi:hypothetical protein
LFVLKRSIEVGHHAPRPRAEISDETNSGMRDETETHKYKIVTKKAEA